MSKIIYIAADHAGLHLKQSIKEHLELKGFDVEDLGAHALNPQDDYPQYASAVARAITENPQALGILSCGNAEGVCIAANKFDGIRAGVGFSIDSAKTMRQDDNANIICVPGRIETLDDPLAIIDNFLSTPFSGEARHLRRLSEVSKLENHTPKVVPTILVQNLEMFKKRISDSTVRKLTSLWQIDVLDDSMFDANSWFEPNQIAKMTDLPELELHLMILNPLPIIEQTKFHLPTVKRIIIHAEIDMPLEPIIDYCKNLGIEVGIAINPETKLKAIKPFANKINSVLIMGVHPGASGQEFLGRKILRKIKKARKHYPHLLIAVDGGINQENSKSITKAGAHQLCVGSAIWDSKDKSSLIHMLSPKLL